MIDRGKVNILGVMVDTVDYEAAVERIIEAAQAREPYGVSALAVHGVMTGADDAQQRARLNHLDLVTPDGQPVRWAMNWLHKAALKDRVYGPKLTVEVARAAASLNLPVYFYGSDTQTLELLVEELPRLVPGISIAGTRPSLFRRASSDELDDIAREIRSSGAKICFVGLGCPRQEVFVYENVGRLAMPTMAVGAAFGYIAGTSSEPPQWMQRVGLQWLHRFVRDPKRLWRRYLILNPRYVASVLRQRLLTPGVDLAEEPDSVGWA